MFDTDQVITLMCLAAHLLFLLWIYYYFILCTTYFYCKFIILPTHLLFLLHIYYSSCAHLLFSLRIYYFYCAFIIFIEHLYFHCAFIIFTAHLLFFPGIFYFYCAKRNIIDQKRIKQRSFSVFLLNKTELIGERFIVRMQIRFVTRQANPPRGRVNSTWWSY
jgi:hypothetical protein